MGPVTEGNQSCGACHQLTGVLVQGTKLRVLALHGFRENAAHFRGRLRGFIKRIREAVTLDFIDAPHLVCLSSSHSSSTTAAHTNSGRHPRNLTTPPGSPTRDSAQLERGAEVQVPANEAGPSPARGMQSPVKPKFAWLVAPDGQPQDVSGAIEQQFARQSEGWEASLRAVRSAVAVNGPYDGCIAFSQGCTIATLLVALQELQQQQPAANLHSHVPDVSLACNWDFKFVMLCSGHLGACNMIHRCVDAVGPLQTASLHVFGGTGGDLQVQPDQSAALAACYERAEVIMHDRGHLIPSARADVDRYIAFFHRAMSQAG
jgi:hypothetical protein